jgi:hypothetical protein
MQRGLDRPCDDRRSDWSLSRDGDFDICASYVDSQRTS